MRQFRLLQKDSLSKMVDNRQRRFPLGKNLRIYVLKKIMFEKEKKAYRESILHEFYMEMIESLTKKSYEMIEPIEEIESFDNPEKFDKNDDRKRSKTQSDKYFCHKKGKFC